MYTIFEIFFHNVKIVIVLVNMTIEKMTHFYYNQNKKVNIFKGVII